MVKAVKLLRAECIFYLVTKPRKMANTIQSSFSVFFFQNCIWLGKCFSNLCRAWSLFSMEHLFVSLV